jgi:hypothetical protein
MTADELKEIIVPREEATFWLDNWGYWCNAHGRFEHKKIIDYFHAAIARDAQGYYVSQINGDLREKVYFRYEDTALFVFGVLTEDGITLVLNTRRQIKLDPAALFIRNDYLYVRENKELIKFNEPSMLKISRLFEHDGDICYITIKGERWAIPEMDDEASHRYADDVTES